MVVDQPPGPPSPFVRYLSAKRSVDDRALNRHVLDVLRGQLGQRPADRPLRVLELGAGNGTMVARLVEWGLLGRADYVAIDADAAAVADAAASVPVWAEAQGLVAARPDPGTDADVARVRGQGGRVDLSLRLVRADLFDFDPGASEFDLVVANAFLDLVDVAALLPRLWRWLRPDGLFWFTVNFDGETILEPPLAPELEQRILALYNRSMDERRRDGRPSGDSRCGRHLFGHLAAAGAEILAAGPSDAVVFPSAGRYPHDEAVFLHHIIDTIDGELRAHAELDGGRFAAWVAERHRQIDAGALTYIAHQLDFLGRVPPAGA